MAKTVNKTSACNQHIFSPTPVTNIDVFENEWSIFSNFSTLWRQFFYFMKFFWAQNTIIKLFSSINMHFKVFKNNLEASSQFDFTPWFAIRLKWFTFSIWICYMYTSYTMIKMSLTVRVLYNLSKIVIIKWQRNWFFMAIRWYQFPVS